MKQTLTPEAWNAMEPGTEIIVTGARGRYIFHSLAKDGSVWVVGGTSGHRRMRAFSPERCRPIKRRKKAEVR